MKPIVDVIHIGFPKTATSWLQLQIIPYMEEVALLGKPEIIDRRYRDVLNLLVGCNEYDFNADDLRDRFVYLENENSDQFSRKKIRLISFELLSGELYTGADSKQLIDRIFKVFGKIRIIITIREQKSIIESIYKYYVASGGSLHIREFVHKRLSPCVDIWNNKHLFLKFRYDRIIAYCREVFGEENVKVIPYELLKTDFNRFVEEYCDFVGGQSPQLDRQDQNEENKGISYLGTAILRYINQIISTPLSDSPFLRTVPAIYTRFFWRLYCPLDSRFIRFFSPRKRFVDKKRRWRLRRFIKGLLGIATGAKVGESVGSGSRWGMLIGFLNWPDVGRTVVRDGEDGRSLADEIDDVYRESNRKVVEMTGVDLGGLGYPL